MQCIEPVPLVGRPRPVPCGKCLACRITKRKMWTGRILAESLYAEGFFVTLTYDDQHLWYTKSGLPDLHPHDVRLFLQRFRKANGPFRYFAVGEYGDESERPHYHLCMWAPWRQPETQVSRAWSVRGEQLGHVTLRPLDFRRAKYAAGYTVKKLNHANPTLQDRHPEFARQSRKPPLGVLNAINVLGAVRSVQGQRLFQETGDVPATFRLEGRIYPLGMYWRNWMRKKLDVPPKTITQEDYDSWDADAFDVEVREARARCRKIAASPLRSATYAV